MQKAFTLIEILLVVVVISLLLAILIPVLNRARGNARKATCASNLRELGNSVRMYVDDYDGTWPSVDVWPIWNVDRKLAGCPQALPPMRETYRYDHVRGYAYNSQLMVGTIEVTSDGGRKLLPATDKQVVFPSTTVAFCDANTEARVTQAPDPNKGQIPYPSELEKGWERHNGGGNYLFCDSHIKWYRGESVLPYYPAINDGTRPSFALRTH